MPTLLIDDSTPNDVLFPPGMGRGAEPRENFPPVAGAAPSEMKLIPRSEWSARIKEKKELGTRISDVRKRGGIKYLNQMSMGYCWMHSVAHCAMLRRELDGQPYVELSAYSGAAKIKNFRNQGGWCGLGLDFIKKHGLVPTRLWPNNTSQGLSRSLDNPENWAEAAKYKVTNDWVDLDAQHWYYQQLRFDQIATCLLNNEPVAADWNWWGHSTALMDLIEPERGSFGFRGLNSWLKWGEDGEFDLVGDRAMPNSAVAIRGVLAAE